MKTDWRDSNWFRYGYLPFRLIFAALIYTGALIYCFGLFMMWFKPEDTKRMWNKMQ